MMMMRFKMAIMLSGGSNDDKGNEIRDDENGIY